jgi:hypothetical protein
MTNYEDIYGRFFKRIEDKNLPKFDEKDQELILSGLLEQAISTMELDGIVLVHDFTDRNDEGFADDLENFEKELIALNMVDAWLDPQILSLQHTLLYVGTSEEKYTSQKQHFEMLSNYQTNLRTYCEKLVSKYHARNNSYLDG